MLRCSHIICRVDQIAPVVRDYRACGFSIEWGSDPKRAHNALLWFEDGPFIEFFQIPEPYQYLNIPLTLFYGRAAGKLWNSWSRAASGWCGVALESENIKDQDRLDAKENRRELRRIKTVVNQEGIAASRIMKGSRVRPDGIKVRYSLFAPEPTGLPFVVSHYDPPQRPAKVGHANGASAVAWVKVGVAKRLIHKYRIFTSGDKWLQIESAPQTGVLEVGLSGLKTLPKPEYLHGAVFSLADHGESSESKKQERN
jgi:hypothetical protein